jgi:hypothetical protein
LLSRNAALKAAIEKTAAERLASDRR